MTPTGPVQVTGEVLGVKKVGAHHVLTIVAPGVPERFRPGTLVALGVGGPLSQQVVPTTYPIHRVRPTGAYGGTVEVVLGRRSVVDLARRPRRRHRAPGHRSARPSLRAAQGAGHLRAGR